MAIVRPFHGMRFTDSAGDIGELCCPPYDIISDAERKAYIKKNPNNIIRLESPGKRAADYKTAKKTIDAWLEEEILAVDEKPCIYIYEELFEVDGRKYSLKGFMGKVFLYEFDRQIILPHEFTFSSAKEDRFKLLRETACNLSPIYSLYGDENGSIKKSLAKLTDRPADKEFTDKDGVTHRLWVAEKSIEVDRISANMAGKKLFIADGHHRYETALRYKNTLVEEGKIIDGGENEADYVMMMLVSMESEGLVVFPTHRILNSLKKLSMTKLVNAAGEYFDISTTKSLKTATRKLSEMYKNGQKGICMFDGKKYYLFLLTNREIMAELMPEESEVTRLLDVNILHKLLLEKLLGVEESVIAKENNITYTRSIPDAVKAVEEGKAPCCFLLNPTRVEEIGEVAKNGEKMPRKSTYFYPKLTTGLVMNKLDRVVEPPKPEVEREEYVAPEVEIKEL